MSYRRTRLAPKVRKAQILDTAVNAARSMGFGNLTRENVADQVPCASGTLYNYFTSIYDLRNATIEEVIRQLDDDPNDKELLKVLAQAIGAGNDVATGADPTLKRKAVEVLL